MYNLIDLESKILKWSDNRGILKNGKVQTQALKLVSEVGELCNNLAKGKDIKDDLGDIMVLVTNLSYMIGSNLTECCNIAYEDIKDRKGFLNKQGNFIKSTDKDYKELKNERI